MSKRDRQSSFDGGGSVEQKKAKTESSSHGAGALTVAPSSSLDVALSLGVFRGGDDAQWWAAADEVAMAACESAEGDAAATAHANQDEISRLADTVRRWGSRLLTLETDDFAAGAGGGADAEWMKTVVKSGTLTDRVAALTLQVQTSPLHHLKEISTLVAMTAKSNSREAQMSVQGVKDLFVTNLLPERRLRTLAQQPVELLRALSARCEAARGGHDIRGGLAVAFVFEEDLKAKYSIFVASLEVRICSLALSLFLLFLPLYAPLLSRGDGDGGGSKSKSSSSSSSSSNGGGGCVVLCCAR